MASKKTVRPKMADNGKPLVMYDGDNRLIPYEERGVSVNWGTFMSRLYKEGDLEVLKDGQFLSYGEDPKKKKKGGK